MTVDRAQTENNMNIPADLRSPAQLGIEGGYAAGKRASQELVLISIAIFLTTGLFSNLTIDPVLLPRYLAWSSIVFIFVLMIAIRAKRSSTCYDFGIIHRSLFLAVICYLTVTGLSLTKSLYFAEGLFEWLKVFLFIAFLGSISIVLSAQSSGITILTRTITLTATIISSIGICQFYQLSFTSIPGNYIIYATLANKNLYASALFLTLPFILYGVCRSSGTWQLAGWVAAVTVLFSIVLARARTTWLAIIFATILVVIIFIINNRKKIMPACRKVFHWDRFLVVPGFLFILFSIIVLIHFAHATGNLQSQLKEGSISSSELAPFREPVWSLNTFNERLMLWQKSLEMANANPALGVGLGQWKIVFPRFGKIQKFREADHGQAEIFFQRPHNDFIWVLSETGFMGLFSYLAIFGIAIFYALKIFFYAESGDDKLLAILMFFGIVGYMVSAFFSFPKERIVHNIFLMIILACIATTYHRNFPRHYDVSSFKVLFVSVVSLLLLILCLVVGYCRLNSEIHVNQALAAHRAGTWQKVRSQIDEAESLFYQLDPYSTPLTWYRGVANHSMGRYRQALEDFKKAFKVHPNHLHVLNNLGSSYAGLGEHGKAIKYYRAALVVYPGFQEARKNLKIVSSYRRDFEQTHPHRNSHQTNDR
jgi:O-antigen ligase